MDSSSSSTGIGKESGTRLTIANCNRCYFLIGEFKRQMTAFETLAGYNSMLTANFLIQTLREVIGKFQAGDNLGFDSSSSSSSSLRQVHFTDQSTSTNDDGHLFLDTTNHLNDTQNEMPIHESSQNYLQCPTHEAEFNGISGIKIKQENDNSDHPISQVSETENPDDFCTTTRTPWGRTTRSHKYSSGTKENDNEKELAPTSTTTTTNTGRVVKSTQKKFHRKKRTWTNTQSKRSHIKSNNNNNINMGNRASYSTAKTTTRYPLPSSKNHHQNSEGDQITQANFTPLTSERLREANQYIKGIRKIDEDGRYRSFFECTICHKSMTVKINCAFHVRRVHFQERLVCPFASSGCKQMFYDCRLRQNHRRKCPFKTISELSSNAVKNAGSVRPWTYSIPHNMKNSAPATKTTNVKYMNPPPPPSPPPKIPVKIEPMLTKTGQVIFVSNPFPNFDLDATLNVKVEVERLCLVSAEPANLFKFIKKSIPVKVEQYKVPTVKSHSLRNVFHGSIPSTLPSSTPPPLSNGNGIMVVKNQMDLNLGMEMELGEEQDENSNPSSSIIFQQQEIISQQNGILFVTEEEYEEAMKDEETENKELTSQEIDPDDILKNKIEEEMELLHS